MKTKFRVLLIDDTKEVLDHLEAILEQDVVEAGITRKIDVEALHVTLEKPVGKTAYEVSAQTIQNLGILAKEPFDYIFSDFGFIGNRTDSENLRNTLLAANRGVTEADIKGNVLQIRDIKTKFDALSSAGALTNILINTITENFINHKGKILIYTNSPKPFDNYFDPASRPVRTNEVKNSFKQAQHVDFILMHNEFGITPEIEALFTPDARKKFYALLLSNRINALLQEAALRNMVTSQSKLRVKNVKKAFTKLTAYGIGFGALVALFGEVLYHFIAEALHTGMLKWNVIPDFEFWVDIGFILLFIVLSCLLFPYLGIRVARITENEIEELI